MCKMFFFLIYLDQTLTLTSIFFNQTEFHPDCERLVHRKCLFDVR